MKIRWCLFLTMVLAATGCSSPALVQQRTVPLRAQFGGQVISVPPEVPAIPIVNPDPTAPGGLIDTVVTGRWTFTTPATVTQVERRTGEFHQFSLYMGRPQPTDTPFVIITVAQQPQVETADTTAYTRSGTREYTLNGGLATEWTGTTTTGAGFCEMIVRRPGAKPTDDVCHALAFVRNDEEREVALTILASIRWTSAGGS